MKALNLILGAVVLLAACSEGRLPTQSTTTTSTTRPPTQTPDAANFIADAIVLSSTGTGCGWGTTTSETRSGVYWNITVTGNSVSLDEDMLNWPTDDIPYSGSLSGNQFAATYVQAGDGVCHFRGGDLSGSLSEDGLHFEAVETLRWGPSGSDVTVQRRWTGTRR